MHLQGYNEKISSIVKICDDELRVWMPISFFIWCFVLMLFLYFAFGNWVFLKRIINYFMVNLIKFLRVL